MLILLFIVLPLFALALCCMFPNRLERSISNTATSAILAVSALFAGTLFHWWQGGFTPLSQKGLTLFSSAHYVFAVDFYMDSISAVFFGMTCIITILVLLFSRYYMHRDPGFRRFHTTILFFFAGLALIIFSGNFETLLIGWEWIGISSFILIAFYRDRFLPTKNGLKVFSLYRLGDALLIVAIWYAHHLFETNVHFSQFPSLVNMHGNALLVLGILFLMVSMIKSAQFPFSYWLPRAMEGPTVSSAIFYGALSVHIGLFLLLRTYPLWEGSAALRMSIMFLGFLTALIATSITRVQSSIKTQIAYASVTQIGIMYMELAAGFHSLVLLHFVSNACLRTYQLLISPSIVSYLTHYQIYTFVPPENKIRPGFIGKIRATLFILGLKEWNMDGVMTRFLWQPLKRVGQRMRFLDTVWASALSAILIIMGVFAIYDEALPHATLDIITWTSSILSILFFIRAYISKGTALMCWTQIFLGQLFASLSLGALSSAAAHTVPLYLSGIILAYLVGIACLLVLSRSVGSYTLLEFHGFMYTHPVLGNIFLVASLAMMVFPITPSFVGGEILLSVIHTHYIALVSMFSLGYVLSGISALRLFAKVFFGPHQKTHHEIAYRSS